MSAPPFACAQEEVSWRCGQRLWGGRRPVTGHPKEVVGELETVEVGEDHVKTETGGLFPCAPHETGIVLEGRPRTSVLLRLVSEVPCGKLATLSKSWPPLLPYGDTRPSSVSAPRALSSSKVCGSRLQIGKSDDWKGRRQGPGRGSGGPSGPCSLRCASSLFPPQMPGVSGR